MLILYAIPLGLLLGRALGGTLRGLAEAELRFAPFFVLATLARLLLLATPLGETAWGRAAEPLVNVGVPIMLLLLLVPNRRYWGARLAALGVACNLAAIAANGGWMPVQPDLLLRVEGETAGRAVIEELARGDRPSNVKLADEQTRLPFLTDVFATPSWLPLANVFSLGDVLGALGVALWIAELMRTRHPGTAAVGPPPANIRSRHGGEGI